jgi:hypothetical protein
MDRVSKPKKTNCLWCHNPFLPRRNGGSPQRFCSGEHREIFWSASRRWAERAVAAGVLTVDQIKDNDPAACTLPPGWKPQKSDELLFALLSVKSDAWQAIADAMTQQQFDALQDWFERGAPRRQVTP